MSDGCVARDEAAARGAREGGGTVGVATPLDALRGEPGVDLTGADEALPLWGGRMRGTDFALETPVLLLLFEASFERADGLGETVEDVCCLAPPRPTPRLPFPFTPGALGVFELGDVPALRKVGVASARRGAGKNLSCPGLACVGVAAPEV